MRFLVDQQLPPALARWLTTRGHTAEHVSDVHLGKASDGEVWAYALAHSAVLVTKDEDFALLHQSGGPAPAVVWVRIGNTSRTALLAWMEPLLEEVVVAVESGDRLIELR